MCEIVGRVDLSDYFRKEVVGRATPITMAHLLRKSPKDIAHTRKCADCGRQLSWTAEEVISAHEYGGRFRPHRRCGRCQNKIRQEDRNRRESRGFRTPLGEACGA